MLESRYILLMLGCLVFGTATIEIINMQYPDVIYDGYRVVDKKILPNCNDTIPYGRNVPVWSLVCFSENYLGNARIIPFISAMALLPLTFLISNEITKDKRISILATLLVSINPIFLIFDDSSAYSQIWAASLMAGIYLTFKKPVLSIPFFVLAVFAKPMAILFIPAMLALTWKDKKIFLSYCIISITLIGVVISVDTIIDSKTVWVQPTEERVKIAFDNLWFNLTKHTTILTIPLLIFSLLHRNRLIHFLIISSVVEIILLPIFTNNLTYPYRLLPLICFAGIGTGLAIRNLFESKITKRIKSYKINNYH